MMTANGLAKLIEECGELIQVAGKKLAYFNTDDHPDGSGSLSRRLEDEIADVRAACQFVTRRFNLDAGRIDGRVFQKIDLFEEWHADRSNQADSIGAFPSDAGADHG